MFFLKTQISYLHVPVYSFIHSVDIVEAAANCLKTVLATNSGQRCHEKYKEKNIDKLFGYLQPFRPSKRKVFSTQGPISYIDKLFGYLEPFRPSKRNLFNPLGPISYINKLFGYLQPFRPSKRKVFRTQGPISYIDKLFGYLEPFRPSKRNLFNPLGPISYINKLFGYLQPFRPSKRKVFRTQGPISYIDKLFCYLQPFNKFALGLLTQDNVKEFNIFFCMLSGSGVGRRGPEIVYGLYFCENVDNCEQPDDSLCNGAYIYDLLTDNPQTSTPAFSRYL